MGRWTQYEEDAHRLPEGVVRTGYDADTQTYFFSDKTTGLQYQSGPRQSYGTLELVDDSATLHMFAPPDEDDSSQSEDAEEADSLQSEDPEDSPKSSSENRKVKSTHGQSMDPATLENPPKTERSSRRAMSVSYGRPSTWNQAEGSTTRHVRAFSDFLPATSITSATDPIDKAARPLSPPSFRPSSPGSPGGRFRRLVRLGTKPRVSKMEYVVKSVIRQGSRGKEDASEGSDHYHDDEESLLGKKSSLGST